MKKLIFFYIIFMIGVEAVLPIWLALATSPKTEAEPKDTMLDFVISRVGELADTDTPYEGIKAEAVAVYTLALYEETEPESSLTEVKLKWNDHYKKLEKAVKEVYGQYLVDKEGERIMSLYHPVSHGKTESAEDVLGKKIDYLKSVDCACDILSPDYLTVKSYTQKEMENFFGNLSDEPKKWFTDYKTTAGGSVISVKVDGKKYSGKKIAKMLSLPSTAFDVYIDGEEICVRSKGKGDSVGLSFYGAKSLAEQGEDYKAILGYFYSGVSLRQ